MPEVYHLKIKKEYAAALIEDLIKIDAVENIASENIETPQWQQAALDKELQQIAESKNYVVNWDSVRNKFKKP